MLKRRYGLILVLAIGFAGTAAAEDRGAESASHSAGQKAQADGSKDLHAQMTSAAREMQSMPMTGDIDHDFMTSMRKHHQDGISMAQIALRSAKDSQVRAFAQKVIDEQARDIAALDEWIAKHGAKAKPTQGRRPQPR
jgi:uncharacterized protein (DUF305 family)